MAFRDFTFPMVLNQLGLRLEDADLFGAVPPSPVRAEFAEFVQDGAMLAMAISTEKAKSEFIVAPILLELRRSSGVKFNLFSGVDWVVDRELGLNGVCDFIIGRGPSQHVLQSPLVAIAEAKNDLVRTGLGQCIAAMKAAAISNERGGSPVPAIHGVVSTGATWKFLRLQNDLVTLDIPEHTIDNLPRIMGILRAIVAAPGTAPG